MGVATGCSVQALPGCYGGPQCALLDPLNKHNMIRHSKEQACWILTQTSLLLLTTYNTTVSLFPILRTRGRKTFFVPSWLLLSTPYFYSLHRVTYYLKDRTLLLVISSTSKLQYGVHVHVEAASRVCLSCLLDQDRYSQHVEDPLLTAKVSFSFPFPFVLHKGQLPTYT